MQLSNNLPLPPMKKQLCAAAAALLVRLDRAGASPHDASTPQALRAPVPQDEIDPLTGKSPAQRHAHDLRASPAQVIRRGQDSFFTAAPRGKPRSCVVCSGPGAHEGVAGGLCVTCAIKGGLV